MTESETVIEVSQTAALFTAEGQTVQLTAEATDGDGAPVPVTWRSSSPEQVSVDADGTITAATDLGSAIVFVEADDEWVPVTVLVARPVEGALLVNDDELVAGPEAIDPASGPWVGERMRATLAIERTPEAGTVILARGEAPIAGRVVGATREGATVEVEYEIVSLPDLFDAADISFDMPLDLRDVDVEADGFTSVTPYTDGSAVVRFRDAGIRQAVVAGREVGTSFEKGPLKCSLSAGAKFQTSGFDISMAGRPSFQFAYDYDRSRDGDMPRHIKVAVVGPLTYTLDGRFKAQAGFEGKAECSLVFPVYIPIGGPLAALLGFAVPVGIGLSADGSLKAVEVEFGPVGTVGAELGIGLECQSGTCIAMQDIAPKAEVHFASKAQIASDMKVGLGVWLHGIVGLDVVALGSRYSLLEVKAGPRQNLDLAFDDTQARDAAYASSYDLRLRGTIGAGSDLKDALEKIIGERGLALANDLSYTGTPERPLAQSPVGELSAEKTRVQVDKPVRLLVDLKPETIRYLTFDNVTEVRIARREDDGSLTDIATIPVTASGQTRFEFTWEPDETFLGMNELVAFVGTEALPGPWLEVRGDSTAYVEVVDACLSDATPAPVPAAPGASSRPGRPTPAPSATPPPVDPCLADGEVSTLIEWDTDSPAPSSGSWQASGPVRFELDPDASFGAFNTYSLTSASLTVSGEFRDVNPNTGAVCTTTVPAQTLEYSNPLGPNHSGHPQGGGFISVDTEGIEGFPEYPPGNYYGQILLLFHATGSVTCNVPGSWPAPWDFEVQPVTALVIRSPATHEGAQPFVIAADGRMSGSDTWEQTLLLGTPGQITSSWNFVPVDDR